MSGREFSEGGGRWNPEHGGHEGLKVVRLQGDRLDTSKVWVLSVEVEGSIRGSEGIVLEWIEKIPDDCSGLEWTGDAAGCHAVTAVASVVLMRTGQFSTSFSYARAIKAPR